MGSSAGGRGTEAATLEWMTSDIEQLKKFATHLRIAVVKMVTHAKSGHVGGALGLADIYAVLYGPNGVLKFRPHQPDWSERDYLLVSNGHTCAIWYAALAQAGFFPKTWLSQFRQIDQPLQGHPHFQPAGTTTSLTSKSQPIPTVPGIENTSGSLGQGLSQAAGLALALQRQKKSNHVYCVLSDTEHQEGQIWEAYMFASQYKLTNLTTIIDRNHIQISGQTEGIMSLEPLASKIRSFGWDVWEVDGHNYADLRRVFKHIQTSTTKPTAILAHSTAGKGVSFMENDYHWHGQVPTREQAVKALAELNQVLDTYDE